MTTRIQGRYIEDYSEQCDVEVWDMADNHDLYRLLLGYGNGLFLESRIVGESEEALDLFRGLMRGGGYQPVDPPGNRQLYQPGDECFGRIVFIDPIPRPDLFDKPDNKEIL